MRTLITGSNRGIGLALATQLAQRGDEVFAGCRSPQSADDLQALRKQYPDRVRIIPLDVSDPDSIAASVMHVKMYTEALDLVVNNAGIVDRGERLDTLTYDDLLATFSVNAFAPVLMFKHYRDLLDQGRRPVAVYISSEYGSLTDKRDGDLYAYCASKAAGNMLTRTFAFDPANNGIIAFIIDPGWVRTRMGGEDAELSTEESATGILNVIDKATRADAGKYYRWNGDQLPW